MSSRYCSNTERSNKVNLENHLCLSTLTFRSFPEILRVRASWVASCPRQGGLLPPSRVHGIIVEPSSGL